MVDGRSSQDRYGPLQTHAPQVIAFILGVVLALATRIGLRLTEEEVGLFADFLTIFVPVFLSWAAGKFTERYTYSKRTRDREVAEAARRR
jgi:hypothetical protein